MTVKSAFPYFVTSAVCATLEHHSRGLAATSAVDVVDAVFVHRPEEIAVVGEGHQFPLGYGCGFNANAFGVVLASSHDAR
jgi:hypothetical protein